MTIKTIKNFFLKKPKNIADLLLKSMITASMLYLMLLSGLFVLTALGQAVDLDSPAANGTFQLYNPLRRLAQGGVIGEDFPFFHGVGVVLAHFPSFLLFGADLFAAEVSKWLVSPMTFLLSSLILFMAYFRDWRKSIVATVAFTIIAFVSIDVIWPGNSLLGFRMTMPFLTAAFMLWRPNWQFKYKKLALGLYKPLLYVMFGLCLALGTEQGMAFIAAYFLVELVKLIIKKEKFSLAKIGLELVGIVIAVLAVFSLLTLGHPFKALRYALIDIPLDQGWYFGTAPNPFLSIDTLSMLFDARIVVYMLPVILAGLVVYAFFIKKKIFKETELTIMTILWLYALIVFAVSVTGYWLPVMQLIPLTRVAGVLLVIALTTIAFNQGFVLKKKILKYTQTAFTAILLIIIAFNVFELARQVKLMPVRHILSETKKAYKSTQYEYLSIGWKDALAVFSKEIPYGASVWSTYASVYDDYYGTQNTSRGGEDYIIHALGPARRWQYVQDFIRSKPDYVITLKPTYFLYEEWLWGRHWSFYKEILSKYTLVKENESHFLWKRNDVLTVDSTDNLNQKALKNSNNEYVIDSESKEGYQVYDVTIKYKIKNKFPLISKLSRHLLSLENTKAQTYDISLPPYESTWQFPVVATGGPVKLKPKVEGILSGSDLEVVEISYRPVKIQQSNQYLFYNNACFIEKASPIDLENYAP